MEKRLSGIFHAVPFITDDAIVTPFKISVQAYARIAKEFNAAIKQFDEQIQDLFQQHPDRHIYESFPGAGPVLESRLAALMGVNRDRWQSASELQRFTGVAPVRISSGGSSRVVFRVACPKFLRQTLQEYAACSIPAATWAKAYYEHQRKNKKSIMPLSVLWHLNGAPSSSIAGKTVSPTMKLRSVPHMTCLKTPATCFKT